MPDNPVDTKDDKEVKKKKFENSCPQGTWLLKYKTGYNSCYRANKNQEERQGVSAGSVKTTGSDIWIELKGGSGGERKQREQRKGYIRHRKQQVQKPWGGSRPGIQDLLF